MQRTAFEIKAEVSDRQAKTFAFKAQKTMYGGKHIAKGDTVFIAPNENREIVNRGSGVCTLLVAVAAPPAK